MRPALVKMPLLALPLLAMAACRSPREQCENAAVRNLSINTQLIEQSQATLARGFAVAQRERSITLPGICRGVSDGGGAFLVGCRRTVTRTENVAVGVDLNAERAKLASLIADLPRLEAQALNAAAQCADRFPDDGQ